MKKNKRKRIQRYTIAVILTLIFICLALYAVICLMNKGRVASEMDRYADLYIDIQTAVPVQENSIELIEPTTPEPTSFIPFPMDIAPSETLTPRATPDAQTKVYALPTPPPIQERFNELLKVNSETVGYLQIGDLIKAPVVQRPGDNSFYLTHTFEKKEGEEGAIFMDAYNSLVPQDNCLILYGHNMRDTTMFGQLNKYKHAGAFGANGLIQFNTIFEDALYVPFASVIISTDPSSKDYLEIRRYVLSNGETEAFASELKKHAVIKTDIDVESGDQILLLVTCNYTMDEGRFLLALRSVRPDEDREQLLEKLMNAY